MRDSLFRCVPLLEHTFFVLGEKPMKNDADMYKKMYSKLFNTITDVVRICDDEKCVNILAEARKEIENIYITYYE